MEERGRAEREANNGGKKRGTVPIIRPWERFGKALKGLNLA